MSQETFSSVSINGTPYLSKTVVAQQQNNTIIIPAGNKYVPADMKLELKVTKAVLTTASGSNSFDIEVPNGVGQTITFHFAVDANGNTTIT